jgi:adenylate cyclase
VKGKQAAEVTFTILGNAEVAKSAEFKDLGEQWGRVLTSYRQQNWAAVSSLVDGIRGPCEAFNLQKLADLYQTRARQFTMKPPPSNWDGVFDAESKHATVDA